MIMPATGAVTVVVGAAIPTRKQVRPGKTAEPEEMRGIWPRSIAGLAGGAGRADTRVDDSDGHVGACVTPELAPGQRRLSAVYA